MIRVEVQLTAAHVRSTKTWIYMTLANYSGQGYLCDLVWRLVESTSFMMARTRHFNVDIDVDVDAERACSVEDARPD